MKSYTLSKRDANQVLNALQSKWRGVFRLKGKSIRIVQVDDSSSILIGEGFMAVKLGEDIILPSLKMEDLFEAFGKVVVDKGAVKYICNGANVMRPGVVQVEGDFAVGDIVAVKEGEHGKLIAVGLAVAASSDIQSMNKGVVVKTLHYVGDRFWEAYKKIGQPVF